MAVSPRHRIVDGVRHVFITESKLVDDVYEIPEGWEIKVGDQDDIEIGGIIAEKDDEILPARHGGHVQRNGNQLTIVWESRDERDYEIPAGIRMLLTDGQKVIAGDQLTEGSKNPHRILEVMGRDAVTQYLLREVQKVYRPQGQNIHDKHFEVIIRKMLSKVMLTASGDTTMLPGELIEFAKFQEANEEIIEEGGIPAQAEPVLLGITKASLNTDSFLSASSFQHTIKVLAGAAIGGKEDKLYGLKENVIIGKLIPAGTGFHLHQRQAASDLAAAELEKAPVIESGVDLSRTLIGDDTDEEILTAMVAAAAAEAAQAQLLAETMPEFDSEFDGD